MRSLRKNGIETCLSDHGAEIARLDIAVASPILRNSFRRHHNRRAPVNTKTGQALKTLSNHSLSLRRSNLPPLHGIRPELRQCIPWFVTLGHAVLASNYGGSHSHGDSITARVRSSSGLEGYSDLIAVVKAAVAEGSVDKDKCAIGGSSAGRYLSYVAVTRDSIFHFAATVCGAGYTGGDLAIQTSDTLIYETQRAGHAPWMSDENGNDTWNRHGSPFSTRPTSRRRSSFSMREKTIRSTAAMRAVSIMDVCIGGWDVSSSSTCGMDTGHFHRSRGCIISTP